MAEIMIMVVIAGYAAWVIKRKIRRFRQGKFCECDCAGCSGRAGCRGKRE